MKRFIVFSDLDGTLLDHHNYQFEPALPALNYLQQHQIPLILNSSKTFSEQLEIREQLDNTHPFVIENGGAMCIPKNYFEHDQKTFHENYEIEYLGETYEFILHVLAQLRERYAFKFMGFNDLTPDQLAEVAEFSTEKAALSKQRYCSEPLIWRDSERNLARFQHELAKVNLSTLQGGRFLHVMAEVDKSHGVRPLIEKYQQQYPSDHIISIALGDCPNDIGMLECVDYPIAIKADNDSTLQLDNPNAMYSTAKGPTGWNQTLLQLFKQLRGI